MVDYFRLDPTTIAEPLVNSWYAWVNYLSPPCLAMYAKKLHAKILDGYFNEINLMGYHTITSSQFNKLQKEKQLSKVKSKLQKTYKSYQKLIKLADQIDECYKVFIDSDLYYESLSSAYKMIPLELRGMVELSYDLHNRIHIRFIEDLFYQSKYYEKKLQSILLFKSQSCGRPLYFLNIPQYCGRDELEIKIPFESTVYDLIFESRCKPITMKEVDLIYSGYLDKKVSYKNFKNFFVKTELTKKKQNDNIDEQFSIQYMGHACLLIKCGKITILIDPQIGNIQGMSYYDLPETIDYVLITHGHQDHSALESLIQIRHKVKNIVVPSNDKGSLQDPSLKLYLKYSGFFNVMSLNEFEELSFNNGSIISIPFLGEHCDLSIYSKAAFCVTNRNITILALADSRNLDDFLYRRLKNILPKIDMVFIGMDYIGADISWLYSPLLQKELTQKQQRERRLNSCNAEEALALLKSLKCKNAYVYAMGYKPWLGNQNKYTTDHNTQINNELNKFNFLCKKFHIKMEILSQPITLNFQ